MMFIYKAPESAYLRSQTEIKQSTYNDSPQDILTLAVVHTELKTGFKYFSAYKCSLRLSV